MLDITSQERKRLIHSIASKEGSARYLSEKYDRSIEWLKAFVEKHKDELEEAREALSKEDTEPDPSQLGELWISSKAERLQRYQEIADQLYDRLTTEDPTDAVALREFRSYLLAVGNELGQLLHRGSGEGNPDDTLSVEITGVDLDKMR